MTASLIITLAALALIVLTIISMYNGLISKKNKVEYAYSSTDVMLKKRHDLIPNLVSTVKSYMNHEKDLLENIVKLRSSAMQSGISDEKKFQLEGAMSGALGQIKVAFENYPDLKSNQNFLQLQASLNEMEEQISAARRAYNGSVMSYNNGVEMFPSSIIAGMMNYTRKPSFEIVESEKANVDVADLFGK